jgi:hypothetical protein
MRFDISSIVRQSDFGRKLLIAAAIVSFLLFGVPNRLLAQCSGPGAPTDTETQCLTAIPIPGNALRSPGSSWVDSKRAEYYFSDRSNAGVDVINDRTLTFKRRLPGFVGAVLNSTGAVNNAVSGPNGVTAHRRWLYAGDGDSTLKVFDLRQATATALQASVPTGGTTRVNGLALSEDGTLLLAANDAEDPPFLTLFNANGDNDVNGTSILSRIIVSNAILPAGFGLALEQPAWEPKTQRFYVSIPVIANNPTGCNYGQIPMAPITCDGGLLAVNPATLTPGLNTLGAFDPTSNTGVVPLHACGPNGATVGVHGNLLLGCSPQNNPSDTETLVINAKTKNMSLMENITGSDQVWFNSGDQRYYTASSRDCGTSGTCPDATHPAFAQLGVIDSTSVLIEKIPQSSASRSVAADAKRNFIFVSEMAPAALVGLGGDITTVGLGICGGMNGCIAVYTNTNLPYGGDADSDDDPH